MQVAEEAHEAPVGVAVQQHLHLLRLGHAARATGAPVSSQASTCRRARGSRLPRARARCSAACRQRSGPTSPASSVPFSNTTELAWPYLDSMRAGRGPRRRCPPRAPSPLPRGSACRRGCRSCGAGRRWSSRPRTFSSARRSEVAPRSAFAWAMNSSAISRSSALQAGFLERLVAREEFLDLHRVVGERFGRRVDGGQAAADDHDRQADLQVGDRFALRRAGELQRHEEVEAARTPRAKPFGISSTVGGRRRRRARCGRSRRRSLVDVSVPPKRTPPNMANLRRRSSSRRITLRKFLSQRTVMPYSATPPNPAITRFRAARAARGCP